MMLLQRYFSRTESVYPTGTVDLMTMTASRLTESTSSITASTEVVSKWFFSES